MTAQKKLTKALNRRFAKKQNSLPRVPAEMGNGYGKVEVEGQDGYIYVTIAGKPEIVYNDRVPNQQGIAVWVGYLPEEPTKRQVLSTRSFSPTGVERGYLGYAPARRYEWHAQNGGQDPLWVHQRALTFLRLSVSATEPETFEVYVNVFSGRVWSGSAWIAVPRQDVDIYEHIPTTTGKAAFVLFTVDTTGTVITTKGSEVDIDALALSDIPEAPADTAFICGAVRVYEGQTVVQEGRTNTDFVDLRWSGLSMQALSVTWDAILSKPTEFPPDPDSTYYPGRTVSASDPAVNDDEGDGYLIGWEWINSTTGDIFFLADATAGAAVWVKLASGSNDLAWAVDGPLAVSDPAALSILITRETEVPYLYMFLEDMGTSGTTTIDVYLNGGASVLSAPLSIAWNAADPWAKVALSTTSFVEGDVLTLEITAIAASSAGLRAILQVSNSGGGGGGAFNLTVEEDDGTPTVSNVQNIIVPNGTLENLGGGDVQLHLPIITFDGSTTTAGQNYNRTSTGTYTSHCGFIYLARPIKLDSVKWDVAAARTYTLNIYRGFQRSSVWANLGDQTTGARTAEVTWDAADILLMPGYYVFELSWTSASVVDDNSTNGSVGEPYALASWWQAVGTAYGTGGIDNAQTPAIKLVAYLGTESIG